MIVVCAIKLFFQSHNCVDSLVKLMIRILKSTMSSSTHQAFSLGSDRTSYAACISLKRSSASTILSLFLSYSKVNTMPARLRITIRTPNSHTIEKKSKRPHRMPLHCHLPIRLSDLAVICALLDTQNFVMAPHCDQGRTGLIIKY